MVENQVYTDESNNSQLNGPKTDKNATKNDKKLITNEMINDLQNQISNYKKDKSNKYDDYLQKIHVFLKNKEQQRPNLEKLYNLSILNRDINHILLQIIELQDQIEVIENYQNLRDDEIKMNVFQQVQSFLLTDNFEDLESMLTLFVDFTESKNLCYKTFKHEEHIIEAIMQHMQSLKNVGLDQILIRDPKTHKIDKEFEINFDQKLQKNDYTELQHIILTKNNEIQLLNQQIEILNQQYIQQQTLSLVQMQPAVVESQSVSQREIKQITDEILDDLHIQIASYQKQAKCQKHEGQIIEFICLDPLCNEQDFKLCIKCKNEPSLKYLDKIINLDDYLQEIHNFLENPQHLERPDLEKMHDLQPVHDDMNHILMQIIELQDQIEIIQHYNKMSDYEIKMNVYKNAIKFINTHNFDILQHTMLIYVELNESKSIFYKLFKEEEHIIELIKENIKDIKNALLHEILIQDPKTDKKNKESEINYNEKVQLNKIFIQGDENDLNEQEIDENKDSIFKLQKTITTKNQEIDSLNSQIEKLNQKTKQREAQINKQINELIINKNKEIQTLKQQTDRQNFFENPCDEKKQLQIQDITKIKNQLGIKSAKIQLSWINDNNDKKNDKEIQTIQKNFENQKQQMEIIIEKKENEILILQKENQNQKQQIDILNQKKYVENPIVEKKQPIYDNNENKKITGIKSIKMQLSFNNGINQQEDLLIPIYDNKENKKITGIKSLKMQLCFNNGINQQEDLQIKYDISQNKIKELQNQINDLNRNKQIDDEISQDKLDELQNQIDKFNENKYNDQQLINQHQLEIQTLKKIINQPQPQLQTPTDQPHSQSRTLQPQKYQEIRTNDIKGFDSNNNIDDYNTAQIPRYSQASTNNNVINYNYERAAKDSLQKKQISNKMKKFFDSEKI